MLPSVIAYTQVTLDDGDPYLFIFYSNCAVYRYNLKKQIALCCSNTVIAADSGPFSKGHAASASLVSMLNVFGLIKR